MSCSSESELKMNPLNLTRFCLLALVVSIAAVGCKKTPKGVTPIPRNQPGIASPGPTRPIEEERTQPVPADANATPKDTGPIAPVAREGFENMDEDRQVFAANTVYFEFDRSSVKPSERSKIEPVAEYLKGHAQNKLRI